MHAAMQPLHIDQIGLSKLCFCISEDSLNLKKSKDPGEIPRLRH